MKKTILFNQKFFSATTDEIVEFVENGLISLTACKISMKNGGLHLPCKHVNINQYLMSIST